MRLLDVTCDKPTRHDIEVGPGPKFLEGHKDVVVVLGRVGFSFLVDRNAPVAAATTVPGTRFSYTSPFFIDLIGPAVRAR